MYRPTSALLLSAALLMASAPFAASPAQTRSISVHSYDLDLSTQAGQAEMQHRIQRAVNRVCGPSVGANLDDVTAAVACSKTAQANAMSQYEAMVKAAQDRHLAGGKTPDLVVR
jgi:UrcA family protein